MSDLDYISETKLRELRPDNAEITITPTPERGFWQAWSATLSVPAIDKAAGSIPWDNYTQRYTAHSRDNIVKKINKTLSEIRRRQGARANSEKLSVEDLSTAVPPTRAGEKKRDWKLK